MWTPEGEVAVERPWRKDYDAVPDHHPTAWPGRFDLSRWTLLAAFVAGRRAGGVVVASDLGPIELLGGATDVAFVWDLRVAPDVRGRGVGTTLWDAAERWARDRGCRTLAVETQDVNAAACRFYAARGCRLAAEVAGAYERFPDERLLLWLRDLHP